MLCAHDGLSIKSLRCCAQHRCRGNLTPRKPLRKHIPQRCVVPHASRGSHFTLTCVFTSKYGPNPCLARSNTSSTLSSLMRKALCSCNPASAVCWTGQDASTARILAISFLMAGRGITKDYCLLITCCRPAQGHSGEDLVGTKRPHDA